MTDWGAHKFGGAMFAVNKMEEGPVEIIPPPDWEKAQSGVRLIYPKGTEVIHKEGNGV